MPDLNAIDIEGAMAAGRRHRPLDGHRRRRLARTARRRPRRTSPQDRHGNTRRPAGDTEGDRHRAVEKGAHMAPHGKKYADAARRYDRRAAARRRRGVRAREVARRAATSTRPSRSRSGSASTPARPTRCCAARSRCPQGTGKTCASRCSPPGDAAREAEEAGADVVGADDLVDRRSRAASSTSTSRSRRPTSWARSASSAACSARAA